LARWRHKAASGRRVTILEVYRTAKGRFALHSRSVPNWAYWSDPDTWSDPAVWRDPASWQSWRDWDDSGDQSFQVFETLEQLGAQVPDELYQVVIQAMDQAPLEDLDI
jgi:EXLDI family protein